MTSRASSGREDKKERVGGPIATGNEFPGNALCALPATLIIPLLSPSLARCSIVWYDEGTTPTRGGMDGTGSLSSWPRR
jgi:hypothetical protein